MENGERFQELVAKMVLKSNYWGYLFSRVRKVPTTLDKMPSIMGVCPEPDGTISLKYVPELVEKTDAKQLALVLEHEGMHLLNKHIPRLLRILANEINPLRQYEKIRIWNLAADCTVNSQAKIPRRLTIAGNEWPTLYPGDFKLPDGKVTEFYYYRLLQEYDKSGKKCQQQCMGKRGKKQDQDQNSGEGQDQQNKEKNKASGGQNQEDDSEQKEQQSKSGQGQGEKQNQQDQQSGNGQGGFDPSNCPFNDPYCKQLIDDHSGWMENVQGVSDINSLSRKIDNFAGNIIRESVRNFNKQRGHLPAHIEQLIQEALLPPRAPYYQIIRNLVRGSRLAKFRRHPTRINRKRTYTFIIGKKNNIPVISPFPGRTRDFSFKIVIIIDTSGSQGPPDIGEALSGVKNMIENDHHCIVHVIECDTIIQKEYKVKRISDIDYKVKGRGGTTLYPALKRAREIKPDISLIFTDGFCENVNEISRVKLPRKMLWIISENGTSETVYKTGYVVHLDKSMR